MIDLKFMETMEYETINDVSNDFLNDLFIAETVVDIAFMMGTRGDFEKFRAENVDLVETRLDYSLTRLNFVGTHTHFNDMEGMILLNKVFDILKSFLPEDINIHIINRSDDECSVNHLHNETFIEWDDIRKIDKKAFEKFVNEYVAELMSLETQYHKVRNEFFEYIAKKNEMVDVLRGKDGYR